MTPENQKLCLKTVVGLSRRDCPCDTVTGKPTDAAVSQSGYYLTDSADGIPVSFVGGAVDCAAGGTWGILADARDEGIGDFLRDVSLNIGDTYKKISDDFKGRIGELNDNTWVTNARKHAVIRIRGYKSIPTRLKLFAASLKTTCTAPITISVYDTVSLSGTPISTLTVNAVANTWQTQAWPTAVAVDLKSDFSDTQDYYITFEIPTGCFVANSTNGCYGCSGGRQKDWQRFIEVTSYTVDDPVNFEAMSALHVTSHGELTLGLSLDAFIGCNFGDWLCNLDFTDTDNAFAMTVAKTLQYYQVAKLATIIVNSPNINSVTILQKENVYGRRSHAVKMMGEWVRWIAENLPKDALRCYECKDKRMQRHALIV